MGRPNLKLPVLRAVQESLASSQTLAQDYSTYFFNQETSCRKGCANCCYHPVLVTILEGVGLYQSLVKQELWTPRLKRSLTEHAQRVTGLSLEVWHLGMIPCPFLTAEKTCSIYNSRPFSCKITYSVGDPEDCHAHKLGKGLVPRQVLLHIQAEVDKLLLSRQALPYFRVPLSVALLYAERLADGDLDIEDSLRALWTLPE